VADLIDTHAHLDSEKLADTAAVLARAAAVGVRRVIAIGTTAASSEASRRLATVHAGVSAAAGIHPNEAARAAPGDWDIVERLCREVEVVGVGETGLDRHWDDTPFAMQEDYFARHLELGHQLGKPVVVHCREADADMLRMLREQFDRHGPVHGVMHSFAGGKELAEACLRMGMYLSFAGMLTYKNAGDLRAVAATVPLDRVLVETDCPYLAPVPVRGTVNEPANVVHTAACLAGVLGMTTDRLAEATTANARRLFALPTP
jgi:TatD DNase family protein